MTNSLEIPNSKNNFSFGTLGSLLTFREVNDLKAVTLRTGSFKRIKQLEEAADSAGATLRHRGHVAAAYKRAAGL